MGKRTRTGSVKTEEFSIGGMECGACERIIEKQAKTLEGVVRIKTDYAKGRGKVTYDAGKTSIDEILNSINERGYDCSLAGTPKKSGGIAVALGVVALLVGAYLLIGRFDSVIPNLDQNTSLLLVFTIGLFTGFHCIAMCGGFVVSYTLKEKGLNLRSHLSYGLGKTLSYTIIGAFFGFIGSLVTFTPLLRGAAALLAGAFLIAFGLNMLGLMNWFKRFRLKTPKFLEKFKSHRKNSSPLTIGLLNGLMIACGPLQALYIFAAASGSPYYGALYLAVFGLGTLPVLLGFGVITSILSAKLTHKIVRYSGVVVILLGLVMVNRGFALTGSGYDINTLVSASALQKGGSEYQSAVNLDSAGFQEIHMNVTAAGWVPNKFVLKKGVPVRWIIDGQQITSCNKAIQVPKLGLRFDIKRGLQTIEFVPTEAGTISWSCWMGMIRGVFVVKDDIDPADSNQLSKELQSVQVPKSGGCGCGGG